MFAAAEEIEGKIKMSEWNAEQYLKFKKQRTQPAIDLANRLIKYKANKILDIGCGPGNSTAVLADIFPNAHILGVDSSDHMIKKAAITYPDILFRLCDVTSELDQLGSYDIIFSNACLQWIPNHEKFIPELMNKLNPGGVLAVQIPMNSQESLFKIVDRVVKETKWKFSLDEETNGTLLPEEYFDILADCSTSFDIWETVYYHNMPTIQAMLEWVKGTRLKPYLDVLDNNMAEELEQEILSLAADAYSSQRNGEIIFKFRRLFFTAVK